MEKIGEGSFSTVYRKTKNKVLIKSCDHAKECMSLGWFPKTSLFPVIKYVGGSDSGEYKFYESKYYEKVKSVKNSVSPFEWEFYQELRKLSHYVNGYDGYDEYEKWSKQFNTIPNKFAAKKRALISALDALTNYGSDVCFEISLRNVTAHNKKLILLDCFFIKSQLDQIRN